ncbi:MAG: SIS domain-containing protein [Deltaproteobacteria bacterium]|nr:SIS domain-containing protein [Deltaproteobacteria bacterium]
MAESTAEFVDRYLRETASVAHGTNRGDLCRIIEILFAAHQAGRAVYTCGNGGSAANASHLACDLGKFASPEGKRPFRCYSLCDNAALVSAITNDLGFGRLFAEQLRGRIEAGDVLVCLSVHGGSGEDQAGPWSQNLLGAARYAKERGAKVVALVGYDGGALKRIADGCIVVPHTDAGTTSTPHVEGFHEIYHHLICERLRQLVLAN